MKYPKHMTQPEALKYAESGKWKDLSDFEKAGLGLYNQFLPLEFSEFHRALSVVLDRDVYTHEFGLNWPGLIDEYEGKCGNPTIEQVIDLLPKDKTIIISAPTR